MTTEKTADYMQRRPHLIRAARAMLNAGFTKTQIRNSLAVTRDTIDSWLVGVKFGRPAGCTSEDEMRAWAESGGTWTGLAENIGRTSYSVATTASILGIKSGRATIRDPVDLDRVLKARASGKTLAQIAAELNVGFHVVQYHCRKHKVARGPHP